MRTQSSVTVLRVAVASCLLILVTASSSRARAVSPSQAIQRTNQKLNSLLRQKNKEGARKTKVEEELRQEVGRFLDFGELAKQALGPHWTERTPIEQREFVSLLRQLIEQSYLKQIRSNLDYKIEYRGEHITDGAAQVTTAVKVEKAGGRTDEILVEYKMRRTPHGWMVYDVITDDVSIVRNYRSQFNRIIRQESYQALLQKMRRKIEAI